MLQFEVLRNDLGDEGEEVKYIKIDGETIGRCKPPGDDQECDFYDCSSNLERKEVSSSSGILSVELTYTGHSHDCDCNKATWLCEKQNNNMKGRTRIAAAARITLHHKVVAKGTLYKFISMQEILHKNTLPKNIIQLNKYVFFQFVSLSHCSELEEWWGNQLTTRVRMLQPQ